MSADEMDRYLSEARVTAILERPARSMARAPRGAWADVAGSAALFSVVIVVALWLSNRGLQNLAAPGGLATGLGRLAGLIAADLMLLQVLLMARIPWVERSYGQDTLARRHRLIGFVSFWLMAAHVALTTIGYSQLVGRGVADQLWQLVTTHPGMLLAAAAATLLAAVVGLSIRAARRRLRYESWHLIHLYAYLGVGLALPHQLWTGADFKASAAARAYWWTFYLGTLAAVLVFRLGLPLCRSLYHQLRVAEVVTEAPGVVSVYIAGRHLERFPARAGQFCLWRFLARPGGSRAHPFSLSAAPRGGRLRITVKQVGDGSARLASLAPGTRVLVEGPFGVLTGARRERRQVLLMAAGIGISPLRALVDELECAPGEATLLYRISQAEDAVFRGELDALAEDRGVRVIYLAGRRRRADSCLPAGFADASDHDALARLVPDLAEHAAYLCGPPAWMAAARTALRAAGIPARHIHAEEFSW
jgi:predicted ferric reductase